MSKNLYTYAMKSSMSTYHKRVSSPHVNTIGSNYLEIDFFSLISNLSNQMQFCLVAHPELNSYSSQKVHV